MSVGFQVKDSLGNQSILFDTIEGALLMIESRKDYLLYPEGSSIVIEKILDTADCFSPREVVWEEYLVIENDNKTWIERPLDLIYSVGHNYDYEAEDLFIIGENPIIPQYSKDKEILVNVDGSIRWVHSLELSYPVGLMWYNLSDGYFFFNKMSNLEKNLKLLIRLRSEQLYSELEIIKEKLIDFPISVEDFLVRFGLDSNSLDNVFREGEISHYIKLATVLQGGTNVFTSKISGAEVSIKKNSIGENYCIFSNSSNVGFTTDYPSKEIDFNSSISTGFFIREVKELDFSIFFEFYMKREDCVDKESLFSQLENYRVYVEVELIKKVSLIERQINKLSTLPPLSFVKFLEVA